LTAVTSQTTLRLMNSLTVQFRSGVNPRVRSFLTLSDALCWALTDGEEFDVSDASGACVWVWEMRP
jgi:hypothetical protein